MKNLKIVLFIILSFVCSAPVFAQSFFRPWASYKPVKPQYTYKRIDTLNTKFREAKCPYQGNFYEPNQIITDLDINDEKIFDFFKSCCKTHPARCVTDYIGKNNKTLLYTLVENKAYRYMEWILNDGFAYDSYIDNWGIYKEVNGIMVPLRNYNPMMLACERGDLDAVKILRTRGAYLSMPKNAVGNSPYYFAYKNSEKKSPAFLKYIETEFREEENNIQKDIQFGRDFDTQIMYDIFDTIDKKFLEYQKIILDKIDALNQA